VGGVEFFLGCLGELAHSLGESEIEMVSCVEFAGCRLGDAVCQAVINLLKGRLSHRRYGPCPCADIIFGTAPGRRLATANSRQSALANRLLPIGHTWRRPSEPCARLSLAGSASC
jgi:hypothetical protein